MTTPLLSPRKRWENKKYSGRVTDPATAERPVEPKIMRLREGKQPPKPRNMGEQELTAYGFAAVRKNPKGQLIIEMATVSPTKSQAKMRAEYTDRTRPRYAELYPQQGVIMVEISARIKA